MPNSPIERYRRHLVWDMLQLRRDALETARYSTEDLEEYRRAAIEVLRLGLLSKQNPVSVLYDAVLDELQAALNSLSAGENEFRAFINNGYYTQAVNAVRRLPGPPPRQVSDRYLSALDNAIAVREQELIGLHSSISSSKKELTSVEARLTELVGAVDTQARKIAADSATISQVVATADDRLDSEWNLKLSEWEIDRRTKDQEFDSDLTENIKLLAGAALVGQRLVEQAAGSLTATDWAARSKRERVNAIWMRSAAFAFFFAALAVGAYILATAINDGFELTVGDGILRGALILAVAGVGTFLSAESRRHFKEADSAEEVALAITAIEPFYASSDSKDRESVRVSVGETIFVKNVLSRFSSRDATKHAGTSNQELTDIVELLTKSVELGKKMS
jgi:hypothetical protein